MKKTPKTLPLRDPLRGRFPSQRLSVLLPLSCCPLNSLRLICKESDTEEMVQLSTKQTLHVPPLAVHQVSERRRRFGMESRGNPLWAAKKQVPHISKGSHFLHQGRYWRIPPCFTLRDSGPVWKENRGILWGIFRLSALALLGSLHWNSFNPCSFMGFHGIRDVLLSRSGSLWLVLSPVSFREKLQILDA